MAFDHSTVLAVTGSNQTLTWNLTGSVTEADKTKELKAQFGYWDTRDAMVIHYLITYIRQSSGQEMPVRRDNQSAMAKRLFWTGDLSRDYVVTFQLVNVQRADSGDYGIRFRVDGFPPKTLEWWFTLSVEVMNVKAFFKGDTFSEFLYEYGTWVITKDVSSSTAAEIAAVGCTKYDLLL